MFASFYLYRINIDALLQQLLVSKGERKFHRSMERAGGCLVHVQGSAAGDGIQQKLSSLQQYTTGLNATTRAACCLQGRSANSSAFFNVVFGSSKNTA